MKIIFTADWQAEVANLDRCQTIVDQIAAAAEKARGQSHKVHVVHLGDIKEHTNPVDQRVTNFLISSIARINAVSDGFYFLGGNHDRIQTQDDCPTCGPLVEVAGAKFVAAAAWGRAALSPRVDLYMVPFFRDLDRQRAAFREARELARQRKGFRILAFHCEVDGCRRSAYSKGKGVTLAEMGADDYELCMGGHVHMPQPLSANARYVGSPFCCDWGESNQRKSLTVVSIDDRLDYAISEIPSAVPGWYDPQAPGFKAPASWKGCKVRLRVPVSANPARELAAARESVGRKYVGAEIHVVPDRKDALASVEVGPRWTDEELLRSYLSTVGLPSHATADQVVDRVLKALPRGNTFGVAGLEFLDAEAENVLSFEKARLDLTKRGLVLVTGRNLDWSAATSNGSGKSNLVTLPFLGLFGKTFKGQQHDEWARQRTKAPAILRERAKLVDGRVLRVERGRRPALLRAFLDDAEVTMGTPAATQEMIERLTNWTWDVVTNAVYVGQREVGSVFGTPKERKELFSRLLGLDRFLDAHLELRRKATRARCFAAEAAAAVDEARARAEEAASGTGEIERALAEAPVVSDGDALRGEMRAKAVEAQIAERERESAKLEPTFEKNQADFEKLLSRSVECEVKVDGWRKRVGELKELGDSCPTCGGRIDGKRLDAEIRALKTKIEAETTRMEEFERLQSENRAVRKALIEKKQANDLANREARKELEKLRQAATRLREQADARKRLEGIASQKRDRVARLRREAKVAEAAREACEREVEFSDACARMVGRDGLPAYVCGLAVPRLNAAAAEYSEIFSEGQVGVAFSAADGELDVAISNESGGALVKDQSMGEIRLEAYVAAFAFRELVPRSILVLDEPGEGLDPSNARAFARGLTRVAERFDAVYVISHNERIVSALEPDHRVTVEKRGGVSRIAEYS